MITTVDGVSPKMKMGVMLFVSVMIAVLFYFLYATDALVQIDEKHKQIEQKQQEVDGIQGRYQQHPNWDVYLSQLESQFAMMNQLLPGSMETPNLVSEVDKVAAACGVTVMGLTPDKSVNKKEYQEVPLSIEVKGSFPNVLKFINRIENFSRFNRIRGLDIKSDDGVLTATLKTTVYVYGPLSPIQQVSFTGAPANGAKPAGTTPAGSPAAK